MLHQILNQQFKEGKRAEIAAILAIKKKERKIAEKGLLPSLLRSGLRTTCPSSLYT